MKDKDLQGAGPPGSVIPERQNLRLNKLNTPIRRRWASLERIHSDCVKPSWTAEGLFLFPLAVGVRFTLRSVEPPRLSLLNAVERRKNDPRKEPSSVLWSVQQTDLAQKPDRTTFTAVSLGFIKRTLQHG